LGSVTGCETTTGFKKRRGVCKKEEGLGRNTAEKKGKKRRKN
jgi:hypothetical protein